MLLAVSVCSCASEDVEPVREPSYPTAQRSDLSPEETVKKLVRAFLDKRLGEYYSLVATIDKEAKSLEALQDEFAPGSSDLVTDYLFQYTSFRVDSSSVEGDSALVYITSEAPDIQRVVREATVVEGNLGPDTDLATKMSLLNERLRMSGGPRVENQTVYFLVREQSGWRAVIGWADEKAFREEMLADSAHAGGT